MVLGASGSPISEFCAVGGHEETAVGNRAVVSLVDRREVFQTFLSELLFQVSRDVLDALLVIDGNETALRGPLGLSLDGVSDQTWEAKLAVIMTPKPDQVFESEVVEAGDALAGMVSG